MSADPLTALRALALWQDDAREALADNERVIAAQRAIMAAQHAALVACGDALHQAQRAIAAYGEIKCTQFANAHPPKGAGNDPCKPNKRSRK